MTECNGQAVLFSIGRREVTAVYDGGQITSDGGVLLLSRIDDRLGLIRGLAKVLEDGRQAGKVRHDRADLLRQRIFQIACGYEDCSDANELRFDPAFQIAVGRVGEDLASQPTLSRLEGSVRRGQLLALSEALLEFWIERRRKKGKKANRRIVLDFDSTDDPTHGAQQLTMFHGYYDQYMYHPMLVFDEDGWPLAAVLRPGNAHDSWGATSILSRLAWAIWQNFPKAEIVLRADAGFASPELYAFCEAAGIRYVVGQITNAYLVGRAEPFLKTARRLFAETKQKARVFGEFQHQAGSWPHARRIVAKAEVVDRGDNPRFVVTDLTVSAEDVYLFYTERGRAENAIKDLKNAMFADRLSCHRFQANQFRLLLHVAAYILMFALREAAASTVLASVQMDTLRLRVLKIGARIQVTARRIWFHLSSSNPGQHTWLLLARSIAIKTSS